MIIIGFYGIKRAQDTNHPRVPSWLKPKQGFKADSCALKSHVIPEN